jgi:hypothetical protein
MLRRHVEGGPQKEAGDMSTFSQERCCVCGELLTGSSGRYCSRTCRSLMAESYEFSKLQFILIKLALGGGANSGRGFERVSAS